MNGKLNPASTLVSITMLMAGCTEKHLAFNTGGVVSTVSEIQRDQVLQNLVEFHRCADILPSQVVLGAGGIQVSDQVAPSFTIPFSGGISSKSGSLAYTKQWTENWSVTPVVDADDVRRLASLYRWATSAVDEGPQFFPQVKKKNPAGDPINGDDTQRTILLHLPKKPWIWFSKPAACEASLIGTYDGCEVWAKPAAMSSFIEATLDATPNTSGGAAGGSPAGGKPKVLVQPDLNAIQ